MKRKATADIVLIALFAALIAAGAFIRIPVPAVPFTLQYLFAMMAGLLLGGKKGAISVLIYISIGLIGIPVFANGGGIGYVLQPTFGYIIGFIFGTFSTGIIANKVNNPSIKRLLAANFTGMIIVYTFGVVYYFLMTKFYLGTETGAWTLFLYCVLLPIPGDIFWCVFSAIIGKRLIPFMHKEGV